MILLYSLAILIFPLIIGLNILIYRLIVKKALRKFIEPKLSEKGLTFVEYKWPGLLSNGDFKADDISLTIMNKNGNVSNSSYAYIFYKDGNKTKKITARIDTTFWFINRVIYSSEI
jgi:hypothetical protein